MEGNYTSISLNINGIVYPFPVEGEENWGPDVTNWAQAITQGALLKGTGTIGATQIFTLTGDVDFGATYGLRVAYLRSRTSTAALTGVIRLANAEEINWRNQANSANLPLRVSSANWLQFNSIDLVDLSTSQNLSNKAFASHVLPTVHNTYDLGSSGTRWKDGWFAGNLDVAGTLTVGSATFTTLNITTGLFGNGSAGSPSISFISSPTTGAYRSAADNFDISTAGINRLNINASGDVSITAGNFTVAYANASGTVQSTVRNDSSSVDSHTEQRIITNNGDPYTLWEQQVAGSAWSAGLDDSDSDAFKVSFGFPGTNSYLKLSTAGAGTLGVSGSTQTHTIIGNAIARQNSSGVIVTEDSLATVTLNDNQVVEADAFTYTATGNEHIILDYSIARGSNRETGTILIGQDGSNVEFNRVHGGTGDTGITFSTDINGGLVRLRYTSTSTGSSATMRAIARRWGS